MDAAQASWRTLFDATPVPTWVFARASLRFLAANDAVLARYGYAREELLGMSALDLCPAEERAAFEALLAARLAASPSAADLGPAHRQRTKSGEIFEVEVDVRPVTFGGQAAGLAVIRDMSAQRRAEHARDRVERRFRAIVEHAADGIAIVDAKGVAEYVSPGIERMLGYSAEELVGQRFRALNQPEEPPAKGPPPGETKILLRRVRHRDGRLLWIEGAVTNLVHDPDVGAYLTNARDVTERVAAEGAALDATRRLEYLLSATGAVTYTHNLTEARVTFISGNVKEVLGYSAEQLVADPHAYWERIHRDDAAAVREAIAAAAKGAKLEVDYRFRHGDGTFRWIHDDARLVDGEGDGPAELVGYWIDITTRKTAEEALRRSEANFRTLIERVPGAVFVHRYGKTVYANRAFVALLGYADAEELCARGPLDIVHPDDREMIRARIAHTMERGGPTPATVRLLRRDGRALLVEAEGVLLDWGGEPSNVVLARDVTERHEMFARIAAADRMLSVGTLAAGVAHEINNPLAFVITNLALVEQTLLTPDAERRDFERFDVPALLRDAREGASRVAAIVRDLRSLARVDDDGRGPSDVRKVLALAIKMAQNELRHAARVVQVFAADLPSVDANESRLGQVFLNLLVNAAQAIPAGHADDNEIRVRARAEGDRVVVEVEDTGVGIPPSVVGRIFDPFFTTKPIGVGTGLGLAICQGIVTRLGGEITVTAAQPRGTCFRVSLPKAASAGPPASARPQVPPADRARILFIDDEAPLGTSVRLLLEPEHEVVAVTEAARALELITAGERYDVVLCDLMMPEMSGIDFHAKVAEVAPDWLERVVYLTGGAFTDEARAFLARLPTAHIEKPFTEEELRAAIARVLAGRARAAAQGAGG